MFSVVPPWHEDVATADRVWRVILAEVGPRCDELWLRFGNLADMEHLLPPEQFQRLEALVGPYWGVPDPIAPPPGAGTSLLGDLMASIAGDFQQAGFTAPVPAPPSKYAPYGCAVVPLSPELLDLLVRMTAAEIGRAHV